MKCLDENSLGKMEFGWLRDLGAIDFAGGTVIEISSGFSGLAAAVVVGRPSPLNTNVAHSVPLVYIGMAMLWFGWCGFNGGSALNASDGDNSLLPYSCAGVQCSNLTRRLLSSLRDHGKIHRYCGTCSCDH